MRLYVGNIPYDTTDPDIRDFFHPRVLTDVKIMLDRETQRPRGFAFVELADEDGADAIKQLHQTSMGGRNVVVSEAYEREKKAAPHAKPRNNHGPRNDRRGRHDERDHDR